jgi:hypothetical protein
MSKLVNIHILPNFNVLGNYETSEASRVASAQSMSGGELGERKSRECGSTQMLISI